jgi:hypothetical protein
MSAQAIEARGIWKAEGFGRQRDLKPEGFEPPTFGSGIRRATIAPWLLIYESVALTIVAHCWRIVGALFRVRDSNPGRLGENQVS